MEIYRAVQDYEGLYAVSNYGNVKSLKFGKEKIIKPADRGNGYLFVILYKDGKREHHQVHRLVASAFIDNPDKLPEVNHKDECKTNNFVFVNLDGSIDFSKSNLEWATATDNINYGTRNARVAETLTNRPDQSIPVDMLTKDDELIRTFPSAREGERWLRINGFPKAQNANINKCCKGRPKYNTAYGFKWRYS